MPVTLHAVANHLAVEHAEGRKQRSGAVARVIVSVSSQAALLHRQPGLGAVQGLNLALLVHAQYQGLVGGIEIQPDHIAKLGHKGLITAELEALGKVRLEAVLPPDPPSTGIAQAL